MAHNGWPNGYPMLPTNPGPDHTCTYCQRPSDACICGRPEGYAAFLATSHGLCQRLEEEIAALVTAGEVREKRASWDSMAKGWPQLANDRCRNCIWGLQRALEDERQQNCRITKNFQDKNLGTAHGTDRRPSGIPEIT